MRRLFFSLFCLFLLSGLFAQESLPIEVQELEPSYQLPVTVPFVFGVLSLACAFYASNVLLAVDSLAFYILSLLLSLCTLSTMLSYKDRLTGLLCAIFPMTVTSLIAALILGSSHAFFSKLLEKLFPSGLTYRVYALYYTTLFFASLTVVFSKSKLIIHVQGYKPKPFSAYWEVMYLGFYIVWFSVYKRLEPSNLTLRQKILMRYDQLSQFQRFLVRVETQRSKVVLGLLLMGHLALFLLSSFFPAIKAVTRLNPAHDIQSTTLLLVTNIHRQSSIEGLHAVSGPFVFPDGTRKVINSHYFVYNFRRYYFKSTGTLDSPFGNVHDDAEKALPDGIFRRISWNPQLTPPEFISYGGHKCTENVRLSESFFGPNSLKTVNPGLLHLFVDHLVSADYVLYLFQFIFVLGDGQTADAIISFIVMPTLLKLYEAIVHLSSADVTSESSMATYPMVNVIRAGTKSQVVAEDLVPGDLVTLDDMLIVPCDILLTLGACRMKEAILTGEPLPVQKSSIQSEPEVGAVLDLKNKDSYKGSLLSCGTEILVQEPGSQGIVIRTAYQTVNGMFQAKVALPPPPKPMAKLLEVYGLFFCVSITSLVPILYCLRSKFLSNPNYSVTLVGCKFMKMVLAVLPTKIFMITLISALKSVNDLLKKDINCMDSQKLIIDGSIDVCCFDKTGTLTTEDNDFIGVIGLEDNAAGPDGVRDASVDDKFARKASIEDLKGMDSDSRGFYALLVLGTCHNLFNKQLKGKAKLIGDPLELAAFEASQYVFKDSDNVIGGIDGSESLKLVKRYPFDHVLARMSVIVCSSSRTTLVCKGSPDKLFALIKDPPQEYARFLELAGQGYRVLALAYRNLDPDYNYSSLSREDVEKDLTFAAFVAFSCPLKPNTESSIETLIKSGHRCIMITGDHYLTAAFVAKSLSLFRNPQKYLEIDDRYVFVSIDRSKRLQYTIAGDRQEKPLTDFSILNGRPLCILGDAFSYLYEENYAFLVDKIVKNLAVACRFNPKQKELLVKLYKDVGHHVSMVGDGMNDILALVAADIGITLQNRSMTEELEDGGEDDSSKPSLAAPFVYKYSSIECLITVLRYCKSTRSKVFAQYRTLVHGSFLSLATHVMLSDQIVRPTILQALIGYLQEALYFAHTCSGPYDELTADLPPTSILNVKYLVNMVLQVAVSVYTYYSVYCRFYDLKRTPSPRLLADPALLLPQQQQEFSLEELTVSENSFIEIIKGELNLKELALLGITNVRSDLQMFLDSLKDLLYMEPYQFFTIMYFSGRWLRLANFLCNYDGAPFLLPLLKNVPMRSSFFLSLSVMLFFMLNLSPKVSKFFSFIVPSEFKSRMAWFGRLFGALLVPLAASYLLRTY